jgi:hypothetical protein
MTAQLLVLHDVAVTWADYRPFVEAVDAMGNVPMTWLVVPISMVTMRLRIIPRSAECSASGLSVAMNWPCTAITMTTRASPDHAP